jgi:hypothetical protein
MSPIGGAAYHRGMASSQIYAEAVPTREEPQPWAAVLRWGDGAEIARTAAGSQDDAERIGIITLRKLADYARQVIGDA